MDDIITEWFEYDQQKIKNKNRIKIELNQNKQTISNNIDSEWMNIIIEVGISVIPKNFRE